MVRARRHPLLGRRVLGVELHALGVVLARRLVVVEAHARLAATEVRLLGSRVLGDYLKKEGGKPYSRPAAASNLESHILEKISKTIARKNEVRENKFRIGHNHYVPQTLNCSTLYVPCHIRSSPQSTPRASSDTWPG